MENLIKKNILIVDDDPDSQKILSRYLSEYNCSVCGSEDSMLEQLSEKKFDLIIMDLGFPGAKNGVTLIKELKANDKYSAIPIVCVTSYVSQSHIILAMEAGAEGFVNKPVNKQKLLEAIRNLI